MLIHVHIHKLGLCFSDSQSYSMLLPNFNIIPYGIQSKPNMKNSPISSRSIHT